MKYLLLLFCLANLCFACTHTPATGGSQAATDLEAVSTAVHGFYAWYDAFQIDQSRNVLFFDNSGEHLRLDSAKLDQYYNNLRAGGFISETFIAADRKFWMDCEVLWQDEIKGDVPSCVDYDRFFCAQDWELQRWTHAPVKMEPTGPNSVRATLSDLEPGRAREQVLELAKEQGKWLITRIVCE